MPAMRLLLALASASLFVAVPASAQAETVPPKLLLDEVATADRGPIALAPGLSALVVPWTYRFDNAAAAPAAFGDGNVTLSWTLACEASGVRLVDPPVTSIAFVPNQAEFHGVASLPITAAADTPGQVPLDCQLDGHASSATPTMEADASAAFRPEAAFRGEIRVAVPDASKRSGPQKQIGYEVEVENLGNSITSVLFEVLEGNHGKWIALLPDPLVLRPGETDSVSFVVATPYHTGYVSDATDYRVRAVPVSYQDKTFLGPPQEVEFHAIAQGWYVPGVSPLMLLGILAFAALVARKRAA
jgi:hypothetical protein